MGNANMPDRVLSARGLVAVLAIAMLAPANALLAEDSAPDEPLTIAGVPESETALATNNCGPTGDLRGDPAPGQALHAEHCAECHGHDGKAEVIIMHMDEPPPDQSDPAYMSSLPDAYLYLAICRGGEGIGKSIVMYEWGAIFTDQQIRDLVAQVRSFSGS